MTDIDDKDGPTLEAHEPIGRLYPAGNLFSRAVALRETDAIASTLLAAIAVEAFLLGLVASAEHWGRSLTAICPRALALSDCLSSRPGVDAGTILRFDLARLVLYGAPYDRGAEPFQGFQVLVWLRNRLVHLRPERLSRSGVVRDDKDTAIERYFAAHGLLDELSPLDRRQSMTVLTDRPCVATWACRTSAAMVVSLVESIPRSTFGSLHNALLAKPWREFLAATP